MEPQTWHHGLIAKWWAEFNDDFRPHEIPYFQRYIERDGQPALDVACGTGRLLIPYLRAGLDVDGCDLSADMVALCREKAERAGLSPTLFAQAMHELDPPRTYRTIYVCGAFGLGSTRVQDQEALRRFHELLEPGGTLLVDVEVPYADDEVWRYWRKDARASLPQAPGRPKSLQPASDGSELGLRSRVVDFDPLEQRLTYEMRAEQWRNGTLEREEEYALTINLYFKNELLAMLLLAGFGDVVVQGDHNDAEPTADDDFLVFVAMK
ncbi:MAG: class I SAM-dependent methyltransferase [Gaiellaceae bacterium]